MDGKSLASALADASMPPQHSVMSNKSLIGSAARLFSFRRGKADGGRGDDSGSAVDDGAVHARDFKVTAAAAPLRLVDRRAVLTGGAAVAFAVSPLSKMSGAFVATTFARMPELYVHSPHWAASERVAELFAGKGIPAVNLTPDPTMIWHGRVREVLRRAGAVAGASDLRSLFLLERLARVENAGVKFSARLTADICRVVYCGFANDMQFDPLAGPAAHELASCLGQPHDWRAASVQSAVGHVSAWQDEEQAMWVIAPRKAFI